MDPFQEVVVVNQLFGPVSGLGMNIITFDWTQINVAGSPMAIPFWAQLHLFGTFVLVYWVVAPILYYNNVRYPLPPPILRFLIPEGHSFD